MHWRASKCDGSPTLWRDSWEFGSWCCCQIEGERGGVNMRREGAFNLREQAQVISLNSTARPDFLRFVLGLLIVMVISRVHQLVPGLAALRPALVLTIGGLAYALVRPGALVRENVARYWWTRLIVLLLIQSCLSTAFGISIGNSGKFILYAYSTVLILAGLLIVATRTTADLQVFALAWLIGVGALAWQSIFTFKLTHDGGLSRLSDLNTFDANDAGLIFVTALPVAAALAMVWRGRMRAFAVLLLVGIGIGIARTGSRGAFLALLVSGALMLVLARGVPVAKRVLVALAVVGALFIAAPPGYFTQMSTITNPTGDYNWTSPTGRKAVTERGLGYMMMYPIFGLGINNFAKAECTISDRVQEQFRGIGVRCTPPHNTWIQVGAELGVPGLLIWVAMLMVPLVKLLRLSRTLPLTWRSGDAEQRFLFSCASALPIAIIAFMVASTFLTFAWIDLPYLLVVFSGLTWLFANRRLRVDRGLRPVPTASAIRRGKPNW